jgi:hypothetical protein
MECAFFMLFALLCLCAQAQLSFPVKMTVEISSSIGATVIGPTSFTVVSDNNGNMTVTSYRQYLNDLSERSVFYAPSGNWLEQINGGPCTPTSKTAPENVVPFLQGSAIMKIVNNINFGSLAGDATTTRGINTFSSSFGGQDFFIPPSPECAVANNVVTTTAFTRELQIVDFLMTTPMLKEITQRSVVNNLTCSGNLWPQKTAEVTVDTTVSVVWFGAGVAGSEAFTNCSQKTSGIPAPAPTPAGTVMFPMPAVPSDFTAVIETTMIERGSTFTMLEAFSTTQRLARSSMLKPVVDAIGRSDALDVFVQGSFQLAFSYEKLAVPKGRPINIPPDVRDYFWPDTETCIRVNFGYDLISASATQLLLASPTPPTYMGQTLVRGFLCDNWQVSTTSMTINWFWTANTSSPQLVRITNRGVGTPPLFVHHPFFQQGGPFSKIDANDACSLFFTSEDKYCKDSGTFSHVHEFVGFSAGTPSGVFSLPQVCKITREVRSIPLSAGSTSMSSATVLGLLVLVGAISAVLGNCCMWCRLAGKVRDLEFELEQLRS